MGHHGDDDGGKKADVGLFDFKRLFLCVSVIVSFTLFGWAQEEVTQHKYGENEERFKFTTFLVLAQSLGNVVLSGAVLLCTNGDGTGRGLTGDVPVKEWLIVALGYLGAHEFGLSALKYIIFPLQVLCKSCKSIPVMFGEIVLAKASHPLSKKLSVALMSAGVVMFTLLGSKKSGEFSLDRKLCIGLALVLGALICDGVYGPYQNKIVKLYKPSPYHLMFNMNAYQGLFSLLICCYDNELQHGLDFIKRHPDVVRSLLVFVAAMGIGNICIYHLQHSYGALTVTTTTTLRKLVSVIGSVVWFGHHVEPAQWVGVCVVVFSDWLGKRIADLVSSKKKKTQ
eukprot:CAMPEP_0114553000 /NCGR_PEP_ID=MMETSP0114-20121206/7422_1 /TAXON_ID=31324 /ORGANISM="Goniomonas sp, Strain m" /LENGTH=338 /DNA_ID=CAMNT_0001737909 /DNA_START=143 /DNA_END=1159 /DNA_ORIENTATION=+